MDKAVERQHLVRAFGKELADLFVESESPDFLLATLSDRTLGVEVTSTYSSNTAAKLMQLPNYVKEITSNPSAIHRKDAEQLEVLQGVTLNHEGQDITGNLVRHTVAPMRELLQRLIELIGGKEAKLDEYRRRSDFVDLVVADDQGQFHWPSELFFAVWLRDFLPKGRILGSGFREIYLNTVELSLGQVSAALKGSLFFNDCVAYSKLIREQRLSDLHLFGSLALDGYGDATVVNFKGYRFVRYGPWIFDGSTVVDIRQDLRDDPGLRLKNVLDSVTARDLEKIRQLVDERKNVLVHCGVLLVARVHPRFCGHFH